MMVEPAPPSSGADSWTAVFPCTGDPFNKPPVEVQLAVLREIFGMR